MSVRLAASPSASAAQQPTTVPVLFGGQRFQRVQRAAGGDNVIHDQDALAVHILDILLIDDQHLLAEWW